MYESAFGLRGPPTAPSSLVARDTFVYNYWVTMTNIILLNFPCQLTMYIVGILICTKAQGSQSETEKYFEHIPLRKSLLIGVKSICPLPDFLVIFLVIFHIFVTLNTKQILILDKHE